MTLIERIRAAFTAPTPMPNLSPALADEVPLPTTTLVTEWTALSLDKMTTSRLACLDLKSVRVLQAFLSGLPEVSARDIALARSTWDNGLEMGLAIAAAQPSIIPQLLADLRARMTAQAAESSIELPPMELRERSFAELARHLAEDHDR